MASTYSPDLRIELIANGEKTGTWGTITNLNLGTIIEDAISGTASVTTTSAAQALTVFNGAADEARCSTLILDTVAASNFFVYVPPVPKLYVVRNASATYTCTLYASTISGNTTQAGSGIAIPPSTSVIVRVEVVPPSTVNVVDQTNYISGGFKVNGAMSVNSTLTLAANPSSALQAATKQYVDSAAGGSFPSGGIIMWSGSVASISSIPGTWYLCNGSNGTPDLRNKFIIGASQDDGGVAKTTVEGSPTKDGGGKDAVVVSHSHTISGNTNEEGNHQHTLPNNSTGSGGPAAFENRIPVSGNKTTGAAGAHSHTVSGDTSSEGESGTNKRLPPYYALCYIMKS
jgi:hypothetical protein